MQNRHSSLTSRCFSRDGNCDCCCCCCCCYRGPGRQRDRRQQGNSPDGQPQRNEPRKQRSLLTRYIFVRLPAVFTGGLNWDKGSSVWINLCHIFIWAILVVLPYTLCVILLKISQAKDIVLNMAAAAVAASAASAQGARNVTLLMAMATGMGEETPFNYAPVGGESSSFYAGPHSASSHTLLSSSSSSSAQASSEVGDPRTSTRQTIAVIYGCLIAVMFMAIKGVLYFVHWKLDLIALDALAENNAKNRNKKKKKGAANRALSVRVPLQPQPLASQPSSSNGPITVNHHVLRSISPCSESSVVNESSASSYAGGDSHSVSHNSFDDEDNSSAFTPVLAPTKPVPASSSSSSTAVATTTVTHVPVPTASSTRSTINTSKTSQQQQQPMPLFQLSIPDKSSQSSSGCNDGHISARSSKISLASFDSVGDGATTGKGRGKKRGKRGDGRRRQSRSEINEDLTTAATDFGDEEPFIPKPDSRKNTKKTPPLPPSIFSGSENGRGEEGGEEGFSDRSYSSVSGSSSNTSTSTTYSETGSCDSDLKKAAGNDVDDDSNYEDGRDERDVRTFVDENGEVMYYSFSSPAIAPTTAVVGVAPAGGNNSNSNISSSSSKVQEALLSQIGPAPLSPVKVKTSQVSAGQQHKQNAHKKHHHRGRKRDSTSEAEDSNATATTTTTTTTTGTGTGTTTAAEITKAEQERNDEEIARALWEQQLNPRVRVPLIKRYVSRETLVKLFDRDENAFVVIVTVILAAGLAFCSYLTEENFTGFSRFWFWVVVAGAQYCLLKAPQPDSFTPSVEGGLTVTYTRSAYLILATLLILLTRELAAGPGGGVQEFVLYGLRFDMRAIARGLNDVTVYCILISPVFYVFSMLPQIDTLLYYVFEQVNILVFGASGSPSFAAALFEFVRSLFSVSVVAVLCAAAVDVPVLRSLAAAVAVALSFLNSRVINSLKALIPTFRQFTFEGHRFSFWIETEDGRRIRAQDNPQLDYNALCSAYPPMSNKSHKIYIR